MPPPNILWVCTDQQRFDTLGCYGNGLVHTPHLDRLARMGVRFEHAFAQSPLCQPSRGSFLTGRYPVTTRLRQNGQDMPDAEAPHLVTRILAEHGYVCGLAGKMHLRACNHAFLLGDQWWRVPRELQFIGTERRLDDGYAEFHWDHAPGSTNPSSAYSQWLAERGVSLPQSFRDDCPYVKSGIASEHHQATWCADRAIRFIEAYAGRPHPWLFSVNIFDPHPVFDPPPEFLDRYLDRLDDVPLPIGAPDERDRRPAYHARFHGAAPGNKAAGRDFADMSDRDHRMVRAAYFAMVDHIDKQVGRLLDALERTGQLHHTLIIFMSDHGELLGDHGRYPKGPFLYDCAVRVPLLIAWPGTIESDRRCPALVELTDLAPTLLDAAGLPRHPAMQGRSLWPLLTGEHPLDRFRDDVYCEYLNANPTKPPLFLTMVRTDRHKLIAVHGTAEGELYDLAADPNETVNLWDDPGHRDVKLDMLTRLATRMAQTADPMPPRIGIF